MNRGNAGRLPVPVVVLFLLAALSIRSWVEALLVQRGTVPDIAASLSYLIVPVCLAALLWPLMRTKNAFPADLFNRAGTSFRTCLYAVIIGALLRAVYWAQLVVGVSVGFYADTDLSGQMQPELSFACPAAHVLLLGIFVMSIVTPLVEEFVHRGLIQSSLHHRGPLLAIGTSALLFTVFHRPSSWGFVLFAGVVLGALFWKTRTLWLPIVAHATTNAIAEIDWKCLRGQWSPPAESLPLWPAAIGASIVLALSIAGLVHILSKKIPGSNMLPGTGQITERVRPAR